MLANPRRAWRPFPSALALRSASVLALVALASGCIPAPAPTPTPSPAPRPVQTPTPVPASRPAVPSADWRDAPQTPGDWTWAMTAGGSTATFAGGLLVLHCLPDKSAVEVMRAAPGPLVAATMTVTTTETTRAITASPVPGGIAARVSPRDPVLDAMTFSRGRFALALPGQATLYVPSYAEVGRVVQDCR